MNPKLPSDIIIELDPSLKPSPFPKPQTRIHSLLVSASQPHKFQAFSPNSARLAIDSQDHPMISAAFLAYNNHIPLKISPEMIWLMIAQGVSRHIELNAEKLRKKFVGFDGTKDLVVRRDEFVRGSPKNDWEGVFEEFQGKIKENIGEEMFGKISASFSQTTRTEKAVFDLTVMDSVKSYFSFVVLTKCGIPKIKLSGSKQDWETIREKAQGLAALNLNFWIKNVIPVLDEIIKAFDGVTDNIFWNSIYKSFSITGSGATTYINGWLINFFPYMKGHDNSLVINTHLRALKEIMADHLKNDKKKEGMQMHEFPSGVGQTDFIWNYLGKKIDMVFVGGFGGVTVNEKFLESVIAWGVAEKVKENKKVKK